MAADKAASKLPASERARRKERAALLDESEFLVQIHDMRLGGGPAGYAWPDPTRSRAWE